MNSLAYGSNPAYQLLNNSSHRLNLMEHSADLADHDGTVLHIALVGCHIQAACTELLQLLNRSLICLQLCVLAGHLVGDNADRMAGRTAGNHSGAILCLQHQILVVRMGNALLGNHEAGAHLHAGSPQGKGSQDTT